MHETQITSTPQARKRGVLATLPRIGLIRLVGLGFPLVLGLGLVLAFHFEVGRKQLSPALDFAATLALTLALPVVYALLVRLFEGRRPGELALRPGASRLALGAAIGFGLFSAVYAVFAAMGVATWHGFNGFGAVAPALLLAVVAGVGEELIFRAVFFRLLEETFGSTIALVLSAAVFGLMHAGNPGATALSSVAVALEAGLMLAAAYAWSRNLWLPIGIHLAWNFTQGGVFGAAVSGGKSEGVFNIALSGSASPLITGGAFGPEASLVAVAICLCAGAVFLVAAIRAGRWRKASFRMVLDRA
jgi:hypothetical protein